jgi:GalNAc-alpha-(1->4)-GalNAc-alpha-(1->3)-diNAcBac-PP-undecaprenol alpha-1,4-N-acetyl-D-galactosaminyltransferase
LNSAINLAILIPSLGCGGAERSATLLANYLVSSGKYNVTFFVLESGAPFYWLHPNIDIQYIDDNVVKSGRIKKNIDRVLYVKNLIKEKNFQVIIGYTYLSSLIACLACIGLNTKCIICERSDPSHYGFFAQLAKSILYRRGNGAIFQTPYARDYFKKIIKNATVIPNLIESEKFPEVIPYSKREKKIVHVGRLDSLKNQKMIISAISKIKDYLHEYTIEIYGEGELREELQNQIDSLYLSEKILLKGKSNNVLNCIKDSKLFLFTSNVEGFPNALLEAMAMGLPCISTDCPAYAQGMMLKDSAYGVTIKMEDVDQLAKEILIALKKDISDESISLSAHKIRNKYDASSIGKRWDEYIERITHL